MAARALLEKEKPLRVKGLESVPLPRILTAGILPPILRMSPFSKRPDGETVEFFSKLRSKSSKFTTAIFFEIRAAP